MVVSMSQMQRYEKRLCGKHTALSTNVALFFALHFEIKWKCSKNSHRHQEVTNMNKQTHMKREEIKISEREEAGDGFGINIIINASKHTLLLNKSIE